jgi:hypothetical protein
MSLIEDEKSTKEYQIDLKKFVRHEKVFPWRFIVKVIIGLTLVALAYYLTKEMASKENERNKNPEQGIEVDVEL